MNIQLKPTLFFGLSLSILMGANLHADRISCSLALYRAKTTLSESLPYATMPSLMKQIEGHFKQMGDAKGYIDEKQVETYIQNLINNYESSSQELDFFPAEPSAPYDTESSDDVNDPALALALHNSQLQVQNPVIYTEYGACHELPAPLVQQNVFYLAVTDQGNTLECGYRTTLHAWAIQELLKTGLQLTTEAINEKAAELKSYIQNEELDVDHMIGLGHMFDIANLYCCTVNRATKALQGIYQTRKSRPFPASHHPFFNKLAMQGHCVHYAVNSSGRLSAGGSGDIGGHWVLVSVIKTKDKPVILYMDSKNYPVLPDSATHNMLAALATKINA